MPELKSWNYHQVSSVIFAFFFFFKKGLYLVWNLVKRRLLEIGTVINDVNRRNEILSIYPVL